MNTYKTATIISATLTTLGAMLFSGVALADEMLPAGEVGLFFGVVPGVAGRGRNPAVQFTPGLAIAAGHRIRYHCSFAYSRAGTENGFDLRPATIGFPIRVSGRSDFVFAVEPLVDIIGLQGLFFGRSDWQGVLLSSGFGVQGVLDFERAYVSVSPLNLQFQYLGLATSGGSGTVTGFGLNMPIRFSGGLRF